MKKKKINKFDLLIGNLSHEFAKIPNFELTQTDQDANRIFNLVITKFSEIQDYKTLYKQYFIPATNKAIADSKKEINSSFYKKIININDDILKENYYEVIRLGYVGLFHKIENFVKDLLSEANIIFNKESNISIEKFYEKEYNFKFKNWHSSYFIFKINWISNCVKHYGGYPLKEVKFDYLNKHPKDEKIKITHQEFFEDIDSVANTYFQTKLGEVMSLSLFKMFKDEHSEDDISDNFRSQYIELEETIKKIIR